MLVINADIQKRFSSTSKPVFSSHPTASLSVILSDILSSALPITMIPGPADPAGAILPQQPLPKVMFGGEAKMKGLDCLTNPSWLEIGDRRYVSFLTGSKLTS